MLDMSALDQEHLRTVLLDTKNRVQAISTDYVGSVHTAMIRVGEIFKSGIGLEQRRRDCGTQPPLRRPPRLAPRMC
jgi:DNA repair protein RadC